MCARRRILWVWNGVARVVGRVAVRRLVCQLQAGVDGVVSRVQVRGQDLDVRLLAIILVCVEAT